MAYEESSKHRAHVYPQLHGMGLQSYFENNTVSLNDDMRFFNIDYNNMSEFVSHV